MKNKILALAVTTILLTSMLIISIPITPTSASPNVIYVPTDYSTIQAAVNAASPGDTVFVWNGTYYEQVVVNKSLTLEGQGDLTILKPSAGDLTQVFDGLFWYGSPNTKQIAGIIVANVSDGSDVTIKNLKVDESNVTTKPTGANYLTGIFYRETGGTTDTVNIVGTGAWSGGDRAYGIYLSAATNTVSVEIKGSTITNYDKNAIEAMGNKLTFNIHDNVLTGRGSVTDEVQNGINAGRGSVGTVNSNTISNMVYGPETWWCAGIMFYDLIEYGSGSVAGNTITDCQIGVIFINCNGSAQGNTINGGTVGLLGLSSEPEQSGTWTASFVNNTVSGVKDSPGYDNAAIDAQTFNAGASLTVTIQNNTLTGGGSTDADGVYIDGDSGSVTATISDNIISGWNYGINLASACVAGATITGNNITGTYLGIRMENATGVQICDNRIIDFTKGGIVTRGAKDIFIEGNIISTTLHDEAPNGIDIGTYSGTNGIVRENEISDCSWKDFTGDYETSWSGSGILVIESGDSLEISGNIVYDCDVGMDIESDSMNITHNCIDPNIYGFVFWNANPKVNYNNIYNNTQYGVYRTYDLTGTLDAENNWWGDASGPSGVGPGTGDAVSGNVDFEPWLSCYTPYTTTMLYIDPPTIDKNAIEESTTFTVEVKIANVTDLYGFDLKLTWNDTLLDLASVGYQANLNIIWTDWDVAMNNTGAGWYRLVAHERTAENGFTGDATLINLTFHIKYGPCYIEEGYQLSTLIHFALVKLSDSNSDPICTKVQDAKYTIHALKPKLEMRPSIINIRKFHETITIEIWLLNASKVYDYAFNITYDTEILDAVDVEWGNFLPGPYSHKSIYIDEPNGVIEISLAETEQAPPANGDGLLVTITFHHKTIVWKDCPGWDNLLNCTIGFNWWKLSVRCPQPREITGSLVAINNTEYSYIPIQGDVNSDGKVDIFDLRIVAAYYDQSQPEKCDLNCDGTIDIFDLVYVAKNFGFESDC
jgi:hypothetical protein